MFQHISKITCDKCGREVSVDPHNDDPFISPFTVEENGIEGWERIYDDVHLSDASTPIPEGFREISRSILTYKVKVESTDDIKSLFMMTPFYYKTSEKGREELYSLDELEVTVDVNYSFFEVI